MTPTQTKLALRLYRRYQCDGAAYRQLAEQIGISTGDLNARCWQILHDESQEAQRWVMTLPAENRKEAARLLNRRGASRSAIMAAFARGGFKAAKAVPHA